MPDWKEKLLAVVEAAKTLGVQFLAMFAFGAGIMWYHLSKLHKAKDEKASAEAERDASSALTRMEERRKHAESVEEFYKRTRDKYLDSSSDDDKSS